MRIHSNRGIPNDYRINKEKSSSPKSPIDAKSQDVAKSHLKFETPSKLTVFFEKFFTRLTGGQGKIKKIATVSTSRLPSITKEVIPSGRKATSPSKGTDESLSTLQEQISDLKTAFEKAPKTRELLQEIMDPSPRVQKTRQKKMEVRRASIHSLEIPLKERNQALWESGAERHQFLSFVVLDALKHLSNKEDIAKVAEMVNPLFKGELDNALSTTQLFIDKNEEILKMERRLSTSTKHLYESTPDTNVSSTNLKKLNTQKEQLTEYLRSDVTVLLNEMANLKKNTALPFSPEVEEKYQALKKLVEEECRQAITLRPDDLENWEGG